MAGGAKTSWHCATMLAETRATGHQRSRPVATAQLDAIVVYSQMTPNHGFHTKSTITSPRTENRTSTEVATITAPHHRAADQAASIASVTPTTAKMTAPHKAPCFGSRCTGTASSQFSRGPRL